MHITINAKLRLMIDVLKQRKGILQSKLLLTVYNEIIDSIVLTVFAYLQKTLTGYFDKR